MKSTSRKQPKEAVKEGIVDNRCKEATNDSKKQHLTKSLKRSERSAMDVLPKHDNRYRCGSQAADVSGELLDLRSLRSTELREWCVLNTKRPEFLEVIPRSLFDLVDKCLTVNPRRRITAEEALMHDFFAACHESLRQQRKLRREAFALESGTPFAAAV
ncbi:hypothetical protein BHE74_00000539 [Ensete ventricosum]|nr:hypothetical protein BHE74_00000539 [Ensete ventricosum]